MQLKKQSVCQNIEKAKEYLQVTLDDDYIIKDNKPDALKIICSKGEAEIEDNRISGESVWITGKLVFCVLYRSDEPDKRPQSLKAAIPFQEKVYVAGIEESDRVSISAKVEDLSVGLINSRKLSVRALLNLEVKDEILEELDIVTEVENSEEIAVEQLIESKCLMSIVDAKKDVLRVRREIQLPKSKANILNIIYDYGDIRSLDYEVMKDKLIVAGEVHIFVLYETEEGECDWYETMSSFSGNLLINDNIDELTWWARIKPTQIQISAETDFDKEQRQLGIEMIFDVEIKSWKEEEVPILKDIYSLNTQVEPVYKKEKLWRLLIKNLAKYSVAEQIRLQNGQEKILQLCSSKSNVLIERKNITDNGLEINGILIVETIYITDDDGFPMVHRMDQIPFTQMIEAAGINDNCSYEITAFVDKLQVNLLDNMEFEVKATIGTELFALESEELMVIDDIEIDEEVEDDHDIPGMVGYIVTEKEKLWDIAKEYRTTVENIVQINNLTTDEVSPGDKIMIVKSVTR